MDGVYTASGAALALFMFLAALDGVYLHLWRYRLYARPASRAEHRLHTIGAVLFVVTLPRLLLWQSGGWLLWSGIGLLAIDLGVELADMGIERRSRADLGGLSSFEYILHVVMVSARVAALTLALVARPAEAWSLDSPLVLAGLPAFASAVAWQALPGSVLLAALHLWLCTDRGVARFEAWRRRLQARGAHTHSRGCCAASGCCSVEAA